MRVKVLISLCSLLVGAASMVVLMSGPLAVVKAECPATPGTPCGNGDVNASGTIDMADAIYILQYFFASGPEIVPLEGGPGGASLPATGQTKCYSGVTPWEEIDCASQDYPGQDGFYS